MQTALITYAASNSVESSAEAASSGQGLRVNSADRSKKTDTLFTKILRQGKEDNGPPVAGGNDSTAVPPADDANQTDQEASVDICSVLAQMMMMNTAGPTDGTINPDDKTVHGILGVINEISGTAADAEMKGLEHAAAVILQNDGKAAEVLSALAASKNGAIVNDGQSTGDMPAAQDAALAGITEALKNGLTQSEAAAAAQSAGTAENAAAAGVIAGSASENTVVSSVIKENLPAAAENNGSKTAGGRDGMTSTTAVNMADIQAAAGLAADSSRAGSNDAGANRDESGFGGLLSRDEKSDTVTGAAENGANQILNGTVVQDETTAEKISAVERALNKLTDDLRSLQSGNQEIKIVLEPESLGVLIISVMKTQSGISAKIKSEDKEVAAIISEHLQKLVSSMQSKGITVDDIDVVYSQTEQNTNLTQHNFSQSGNEASKEHRLPPEKNSDAEASNNEIWQSYYGDETSGDTTVDYRV